jgi:mannose-6-phosphate isomerase-like protein (cupin superfamily)/DNA-binding XRE family transcriptional regulator
MSNLQLIAERIKGLRSMLEISAEEMAKFLGITTEEYLEYETGGKDFGFTFLYEVSRRFGVDITEILTGVIPKLSTVSVIRKGEGLPIERRSGFNYLHLAYPFRNKQSEPFFVTAKYEADLLKQPIAMSRHPGQEFDYILDGSLKISVDGHETILNEGDSVYYDSGCPHGMIAIGGTDCHFIAVVMKPSNGGNDNVLV